MSNAELIRVDFKSKKVLGRHKLGQRVKTFTCNSCQNVYDVSGDVKGIQFATNFLVCEYCVKGVYELLNNGGV